MTPRGTRSGVEAHCCRDLERYEFYTTRAGPPFYRRPSGHPDGRAPLTRTSERRPTPPSLQRQDKASQLIEKSCKDASGVTAVTATTLPYSDKLRSRAEPEVLLTAVMLLGVQTKIINLSIDQINKVKNTAFASIVLRGSWIDASICISPAQPSTPPKCCCYQYGAKT